MSTIAADPLALIPRGDAVPAGATTSGTAAPSGDGADFAEALADVMSAEPPAPVRAEGDAAVPATTPEVAGAEDAPLPLLEGLGRIAVPMATTALDAAVPGGALAEGEGPATDVAALSDAAGEAEDASDLGVIPSELGDAASGEGEATEEVPATALAEAMTVAVAAVVAAPVAAPQTPAKTEMPNGDAGSESVRMAGAAMLMAPAAKPRDAKAVSPDAQAKAETAPEEAGGEEAEAAPPGRETSGRVAAKPMLRATPAVGEQAAQPHAERRVPEPVAVKPEAARAPDPAPTQAPLPTTAPAQTAALPSGPVAMDRPGWEGVVTERILAELSQDGQQIELELTPENLGGLKIRLEISDGQAQVRFVTETPEAARLIQQNEHRLSESLSRAGLSLGGHESGSRDAQQQQGDRSGRPAPRSAEIAFQRSGEPRLGMIPQRAQVGLVNLMA